MGLRLPFVTCGAFILLGLVLMVVVPRATPARPAPATREAAITVTRVESPHDELSDRIVATALLDYDRDEPKACAPVAPPAAEPVVATPAAAPPGDATGVGHVRVSTYPWGWAIAGDQKVETIGSGKLTLPVGKQLITIKCAECTTPRETTRLVDVRANMTLPIRINWEDEDE